MINFIDLKRQQNQIKSNLNESIENVLSNGNYIMGEDVRNLEAMLSEYVGQECITVANGTDALFVSLLSCGIEPGDEVIVPSFTWVSTAEVVCLAKATPVFIDIDETFNLDIQQIERLISKKTKAIIPVSMFGLMPNLEQINEIAERYGLTVIEDAAQSFGAKFNEKISCSLADISTTSFFPAKPLGCYGDGGAVFIKNKKFLKKAKSIPRHGQDGRYNYIDIGLNSRLDTLQAAILIEKLKIFEDEIQLRNKVANFYIDSMSSVENIKLPQKTDEHNRSVWAQFTIRLGEGLKEHRKDIMNELKANGIPTALYYPVPLHTAECYKSARYLDLKNTEEISNEVISIPMHPYLENKELNYISEKFKASVAKFY